MTTATPTSTNSKTQEQFKEINKNESNENNIDTPSIGVGRDRTSIVSIKQQAISTIIGDECVSYFNE